MSAIKALTPGARLGNFEIVALIGRGGIGEVYRARDSRLKRDGGGLLRSATNGHDFSPRGPVLRGWIRQLK